MRLSDCIELHRYTKQNERALQEAKSALETGEIRTPSPVSSWSSYGGGAEGTDLVLSHHERSTSDCSSGEEYQPRCGRRRRNTSNSSIDKDIISDSAVNHTEGDYGDSVGQSGTAEESEEEELRTSNYSSETEGSWEPADTSSTSDSSSEEEDSEVSCMNISFIFSPHTMLILPFLLNKDSTYLWSTAVTGGSQNELHSLRKPKVHVEFGC